MKGLDLARGFWQEMLRPALKEQEAKKQGHFESGSSPGPVAEGAWGWESGGAGEGVGSGDGGETRSSEQS